MNLTDFVDIDVERVGGKPTLKGRRFTVAQMLAEMSQGATIDSLVEDYELTADIIKDALQGVAMLFDRSFVDKNPEMVQIVDVEFLGEFKE